jgi:hypothetical protein
MKAKSYTMPIVPGIERACVLFVAVTPGGNLSYRCFAWQIAPRIYTLELVDGNQVEIHDPHSLFLHIPKPGHTFELDGTCRELKKEEPKVVLM